MTKKRIKKFILESVKKWDNIIDNNGIDKGTDNCPLCQKLYNPLKLNKCSSCPVYVKTLLNGCGGTPYIEWRCHQIEKHCWDGNKLINKKYKIYCSECKKLAIKERDFLRALVKEYEK